MTDSTDPRDWDALADRLAQRAIAQDQPTRWFEEIWAAGDADVVEMPWSRTAPQELMAAWVAEREQRGQLPGADRAVVVGCGLGADSEFLAGHGWSTTAFDISPTAIKLVRERHPGSDVDYRVADLLALPQDMVGVFDLVVDIYTVQALPRALRPQATAGLRALLAPGGVLLAFDLVLPNGAPLDQGPPWLLDEADIASLAGDCSDGDAVTMQWLQRLPPAQPGRAERWWAVLVRESRT